MCEQGRVVEKVWDPRAEKAEQDGEQEECEFGLGMRGQASGSCQQRQKHGTDLDGNVVARTRGQWLKIFADERMMVVYLVQDVGECPLRLSYVCQRLPGRSACSRCTWAMRQGMWAHLVDPVRISGALEMILESQRYGLDHRLERIKAFAG